MQDLNALLADFNKIVDEMHGAVKNSLAREFGIEAVKQVRDNFHWQAYNSGSSYTSWQARKSATNIAYSVNRGKGGNSRYKGSVYNAANPLLQQTRTLFNSIKYTVESGGNVFVGVNLDLAPYAPAHNEGENHQPKRQFMPTPEEGPNKRMTDAFAVITKKRIDEIMSKMNKE